MTPSPESIELRADGLLLRFSSNLLSFLANRDGWRRFHIGDWLQSLDGDMLGHLQQLAETALHDPQSIGSALEDMVSVVLHALAAERQAMEVSFRQDELGRHVELLCILTTLERLRRKGLLSYESVMSIELEAPNSIMLNPDALAHEGDIRRQMLRGLH
jgi:hypothetical protein